MSVTISSVITMFFLNSLLILLLCLLFKNNNLMQRIGPKCMILLLIFALIRMFLPFEFSYTYSIGIEEVCMPFWRLLKYSFLPEPLELTIWQAFIFIWAAGIVFLIIRKWYIYRRVIHLLKFLPEEKWESFCEKYQINPAQFQGIERIKIVRCNLFESPCLIGLKRRFLVLSDMEYDKEQFYYIILHEMMHMKNKDTVWKTCIDFLCMIFWWNPIFWILRKEVFQLLEVQNDTRIAKILSENERIYYMECLKDTAVQISREVPAYSTAFSGNDLKELKRRLNLLAGYKSFCHGRQVILGLLVCMALFMTSAVILEPYSLDKIEDDGIPLTPENTYLIKSGEGYKVYFQKKYLFTTNDISPFKGMTIYESNKEAEKNE